jgi:hypothetical protein
MIVCSEEPYIEVRINKYLCDAFPIQNGLEQGVTLLPMHTCTSEYYLCYCEGP